MPEIQLTWETFAGIGFFVVMGWLAVYYVRLYRFGAAQFSHFIHRYGFTKAEGEHDFLKDQLKKLYPYQSVAERMTGVRGKEYRIQQAYRCQIKGKPVYFLETSLRLIRLNSRTFQQKNFFLLPVSRKIEHPFILYIEPDWKIPWILKAQVNFAKKLLDSFGKVANLDRISMGEKGEIELHQVAIPKPYQGITAFCVKDRSPFDYSFVPDLVWQARKKGILLTCYRDGFGLFETIYLTSYNFQGGKQMIDPVTQLEFLASLIE